MVLGNTFQPAPSHPGPELMESYGGLGEFMRWPGPIITDSGGFQVFSMGHGSVADEIKGRAKSGPGGGGRAGLSSSGAILSIEEDGVRFRSYLDGSLQFMSPETSMAMQGALRSDIALVFDECTPFHVTRDYTARSTERTHRWLERVPGLARGPRTRGPDRLRHRSGRRGTGSAPRVGRGDRQLTRRRRGPIGGSLGQDKAQMHEVVGLDHRRTGPSGCRAASPPARDRRHRRPDRRGRPGHRHLRLRDADPSGPSRGRHRARPRRPLARRSGQGPLEGLSGTDHGGAAPAPRAPTASPAAICTTAPRPGRPPARAC